MKHFELERKINIKEKTLMKRKLYYITVNTNITTLNFQKKKNNPKTTTLKRLLLATKRVKTLDLANVVPGGRVKGASETISSNFC